VTQSVNLQPICIAEHAKELSEPFTVVDLAQIDDLTLSLYLCQGTMSHHRHLDQDELFLVHSGTISLESEWGTAILRPGELAVTPKGVGHRSSSLLRSLVLLLQPRLMVNRRNGDRRFFARKDDGHLEKVSVPAMGRQVVVPFRPVTLAHVDTFAFVMELCTGTGPWAEAERQSSLILCYQGTLILETEHQELPLAAGELAVVPKGLAHRISSEERSLALGVQRHPQPGLATPG
jgi:homogentisate 1,2-dioxygenase